MRELKGLILTEALVAIATLTTAVLVLSSILTNAVSTTAISKDYLQAQNLVTEGVEALKNIRDTNWMNFPDDKTCWLALQKGNCSAKVTGSTGNTNPIYIPKRENGAWKLISKDACAANDMTKLEACNLRLKKTILGDGSQLTEYVDFDKSLTESKFFRSIKLIELTGSDSALFEVRVQWMDGAKLRTVKRVVTLYNYIK